MCDEIKVPEGSAGQQQYWPGDKQLKPQDSGPAPEKDQGTREPEETKIPKVQ